MSNQRKIPRREFLKVSAAVGGGLLISLYLQACESAPDDQLTPTLVGPEDLDPTATPNPDALFEPSVFVRIDGTGAVKLSIPRPDIGQGCRTAVAMILAEEIGARWESIQVEQAPVDSRFGNQGTGGSDGISDIFTLLQRIGAVARILLLTAASQTWDVPIDSCVAADNAVIHQPTGRRFSFGDLAELASTLPMPRLGEVRPKDREDYSIIGTRIKRIDGPQMVDGSTIYGIDISIPRTALRSWLIRLGLRSRAARRWRFPGTWDPTPTFPPQPCGRPCSREYYRRIGTARRPIQICWLRSMKFLTWRMPPRSL
jgi:hypothetical protein